MQNYNLYVLCNYLRKHMNLCSHNDQDDVDYDDNHDYDNHNDDDDDDDDQLYSTTCSVFLFSRATKPFTDPTLEIIQL